MLKFKFGNSRKSVPAAGGAEQESSAVVMRDPQQQRSSENDMNANRINSVASDKNNYTTVINMVEFEKGPVREMAVDVPENFIARSKTPPRYPQIGSNKKKHSTGQNGSLPKPVPPPRDTLIKDTPLLNGGGGASDTRTKPQPPARTTATPKPSAETARKPQPQPRTTSPTQTLSNEQKDRLKKIKVSSTQNIEATSLVHC